MMKNLFICSIILLWLCPSFAYAHLSLRYTIFGLNGSALKNVQNRLTFLQQAIPKPLTQQKIINFYHQAPENIQKALQPYGYFHAHITTHLKRKKNHWTASYVIQLGRPVRITQIHLTLSGAGKHAPAFIKLRHQFPLRRGSILNTELYKHYKQMLYNTAQANGYLKAKLTQHQILIDKQHNTAVITLDFNTGPRYYFGMVSFSKNPYSLKLLRRYVPFKPGQGYNSRDLAVLQNNLAQSVYFQQVLVQPQVSQAHQRSVPIKVVLIPRKAQQYNFGIGYGTDTGVRGSIGWNWWRVTPDGDTLQALIQASQRQYNFQLRYSMPGANPVTDHYNLTIGLINNRPSNDEYTALQFTGSYVKKIHGWERTLSIKLLQERFRINQQPTRNASFVIPGIAWQRIDADNRINTTNGYRFFVNLQAGQSLKFSNTNFLQGEIQAKYINTFTPNTRLLLRTDVGATLVKSLNTFNTRMPASQRFYAGGAQSVRGYDFQALGPGRYLLTGSAEVQQRLYGNFYGALFYDAGNAFNTLPIDLQQGAGLGLVYRSPFGPIEITVAYAFNRPHKNFFSPFKIQFSLGPDL